MLCGADGIDVDDWEKHTEYENGYTRDSKEPKGSKAFDSMGQGAGIS